MTTVVTWLIFPKILMYKHPNATNTESNLTHWGQDKIATISQTALSITFSWMKVHEFRLRFHWRLVLRFEIKNIPALVQKMTRRRLTHMCVTRPKWVNVVITCFLWYVYKKKNNTSHAIVTWPHPKQLRLFFMIRCKTNVWYNGPSGMQNQGLWIIWGVSYIVSALILSKLSSMQYHAEVNKWTDMITKNSPRRKKSIFSFFDCLKKMQHLSGKYWLKWPVAWRHKVIIRTNVDFSSTVFGGVQLRTNSQEALINYIHNICSEITLMKLQLYPLGVNELMQWCSVIAWYNITRFCLHSIINLKPRPDFVCT